MQENWDQQRLSNVRKVTELKSWRAEMWAAGVHNSRSWASYSFSPRVGRGGRGGCYKGEAGGARDRYSQFTAGLGSGFAWTVTSPCFFVIGPKDNYQQVLLSLPDIALEPVTMEKGVAFPSALGLGVRWLWPTPGHTPATYLQLLNSLMPSLTSRPLLMLFPPSCTFFPLTAPGWLLLQITALNRPYRKPA